MRGGVGSLRVAEAIHKRLLAILEILGIAETCGIPENFVHKLGDPDGMCRGTIRIGEDTAAGRVSHVASVVRAI